MEAWGRSSAVKRSVVSMDQRKPVSSAAVLRELFELLEDYAPSWYTEEHHNRAAEALGEALSARLVH